jgi:hypothetical protein
LLCCRLLLRLRPGEGLGDEVGDVCEASETLGSVEEEGADVKEVEICEAEEEEDCKVGMELVGVPSVDIDATLLSGVVFVDTVLKPAVTALGARLLGSTNVTVHVIGVVVASPVVGSSSDTVNSPDATSD